MTSPRFLFAIHTPNLILRLNEPRYCLSKNVRPVLKRGVVEQQSKPAKIHERLWKFWKCIGGSSAAARGPRWSRDAIK